MNFNTFTKRELIQLLENRVTLDKLTEQRNNKLKESKKLSNAKYNMSDKGKKALQRSLLKQKTNSKNSTETV